MRGRKPVPTNLREARGNPGHRPLNRNEPQLDAMLPDPPEWLDGEARARWDELAPQLEGAGLLTSIDAGALAAYCQVWARWRKAEEAIVQFGQVIKTPEKRDRKGRVISGGYPVQSPYIGIANKALSHVRALECEFGMTPSSRSRVKVAKAKTPADRQRERFFGVIGGRR
jgi:P27 family predicted phage terminase small subunit